MSPEDIQQCEDRFNKSKMVHSIMRHVAETTGENLEVGFADGFCIVLCVAAAASWKQTGRHQEKGKASSIVECYV